MHVMGIKRKVIKRVWSKCFVCLMIVYSTVITYSMVPKGVS